MYQFGYSYRKKNQFSISICWLCALYLLINACSTNEKFEISRVEVKAELFYSSDTLGLPMVLEQNNRQLIIGENESITAAHIIDIEAQTYLKSLGSQGRGPGEFRSVTSLDFAPGKPDKLWVYDATLQRFTSVNLAKFLNERPDPFEDIINIEVEGFPLSVYWLDNNTLITNGFFSIDKNLCLIYPKDDSAPRYVGEVKRAGIFTNNQYPPRAIQQAYQSDAKTKPDGTKIAVVYRFTDRIEIYNNKGELLERSRGPAEFEPNFDITASGVLNFLSDTKYAYVDVATTEEYIYALYSGVLDPDENHSYGRAIHVFDWEGKLDRIIELNTHVISIAVNDSSNLIFGIQHFPKVAVVSFKL